MRDGFVRLSGREMIFWRSGRTRVGVRARTPLSPAQQPTPVTTGQNDAEWRLATARRSPPAARRGRPRRGPRPEQQYWRGVGGYF
eukprot:2130303-Prymnesium_polylepis.1